MKTTRIINLTGHRVTVYSGKKKSIFEPSGMVARLIYRNETLHHFVKDGVHAPINRLVASSVKGLPPKRDGVLLIVSVMVRAYLHDRRDLASPTHQIKRSGTVVGCRALLTN